MQPQLNASASPIPALGIDTSAAARAISPARSFTSLATVQSKHAQPSSRRIAGGANTRVGRRPGTGESALSVDTQAGGRRAQSVMSYNSGSSVARAPSLGGGGRAGRRAAGTPTEPMPHPSAQGAHAHTQANMDFIATLHSIGLAPSEISRINYLLAVGGSVGTDAEKPLPETLVASLPDFTPAQMAFVQRLWVCDVPLAEISRTVEEMRDRERERFGSGENGGEVGVAVGGLGDAPPGYAP